jgi:hypothetical protein
MNQPNDPSASPTESPPPEHAEQAEASAHALALPELPPVALGSTVNAEIHQQIATARRFPRSITAFVRQVREMATVKQSVAAECTYAIPRDDKLITGPSARFAEIVASAWGNCRIGARVIADTGEHIVAQGVFHDLERNVALTIEVSRRITNNKGKRYGADMIGVTGNAACSIALRNAVFKGVPKAFWAEAWEQAQRVAGGNLKTISASIAAALQKFAEIGVTAAKIYERLGVQGERDITIAHLQLLNGILVAITDGDTTAEESFPDPAASTKGKPRSETLADSVEAKKAKP